MFTAFNRKLSPDVPDQLSSTATVSRLDACVKGCACVKRVKYMRINNFKLTVEAAKRSETDLDGNINEFLFLFGGLPMMSTLLTTAISDLFFDPSSSMEDSETNIIVPKIEP